jgi:hypothetical protein
MIMMQTVWVDSQSQIRHDGTQRMALAILNAREGRVYIFHDDL